MNLHAAVFARPAASRTFAPLEPRKLHSRLLHSQSFDTAGNAAQVLDMVGGIRLSGKVQCDPALFSGESQAWMDLPSQDAKPDLQAEFNVQYELVSRSLHTC